MRVASTPPPAAAAILEHRYGYDVLWMRTHLALTLGFVLALGDFLAPAGAIMVACVLASAVAYRRAVDRLVLAPSRARVDAADLWRLVHTQVASGAVIIGLVIIVVTLLELL